MGVIVKKGEEGYEGEAVSAIGSMAAPTGMGMQGVMPNGGYFLAPALGDKSKKRKR